MGIVEVGEEDWDWDSIPSGGFRMGFTYSFGLLYWILLALFFLPGLEGTAMTLGLCVGDKTTSVLL